MLLTFQEAVGLLGVSEAAVQEMVHRVELPVCKIDRAVRILVKQLKEYIEAARAGEGEGRAAGCCSEELLR